MILVTWFAALVLAAPGTPRPVGLAAEIASDDDPFQWSVSVSPLEVGRPGLASVRLALPDGFRVMRDTVSVRPGGDGSLQFGKADLPQGIEVTDPKGRTRQVYDMDVVVTLPITAFEEGLARGTLHVQWQACHQGLCLPARIDAIEVFAPVE